MTDTNCPDCGVPEACFHLDGCEMRATGFRPCCGSLIWSDEEPTHESWCAWADGGRTEFPTKSPFDYTWVGLWPLAVA